MSRTAQLLALKLFVCEEGTGYEILVWAKLGFELACISVHLNPGPSLPSGQWGLVKPISPLSSISDKKPPGSSTNQVW